MILWTLAARLKSCPFKARRIQRFLKLHITLVITMIRDSEGSFAGRRGKWPKGVNTLCRSKAGAVKGWAASGLLHADVGDGSVAPDDELNVGLGAGGRSGVNLAAIGIVVDLAIDALDVEGVRETVAAR